MSRRPDQGGFTIPELLVVIILTSFFTTLLFSFIFQYLQIGYISSASLDTYVSRLNAGDILRESVGTSSGLITQNSLADTHTVIPDTSIASGNFWIPIHAIPVTTSLGATGTYTSLMYYRRFAVNSTNNLIMNGSQPYEDEYVLYLDSTNKQVLLRTIANPNATGDKAVSSCLPANATASCPADKIVAREISQVSLRYFSRTGNTIDYTSSTDPSSGQYNGPDYPSVEAVEFTLRFSVKPIFQKTNAVQSSTVIRVALRNA